MRGRVPCNTTSVSTPPAICNLHTAQMDQILTSAYKASSFFSYSNCQPVLHFMKSFKPFEKPRLFSHPAKYKLQALIFSSGHLRYTKLSSEIVNGSIYCLLQTIPFIFCSISALMVWGREDKWGFSRVNSFAHHCSCSGNHFQGHVAHLRRHSCSFPLIHSFTVHAFPACLTESPGFYWEMIKTHFLPGKKLCCYAFCTSWLWKMLILSRLGISVVVV